MNSRQKPGRGVGISLILMVFWLWANPPACAESYVITNSQTSEPIKAFTALVEITNHPPWFPIATRTTLQAPVESGGYHFTHWTLNGIRMEDEWGQATNQFSFVFTNSAFAVAHYVPTQRFTADSLVPDWYKIQFYSTTNLTASSDTDGDGFSLYLEYLRGYHPRIQDEITEGGVSRRRSAPITIDLNPRVFTVRQFSEPSGIFSNYWRFPQATNVILEASPAAVGYAFTGWFANGARLDDPLSLAAKITVAITNDLTLIGKFTAAGADADRDGLPDSFELFYFSTLAYSGVSDPDGDGFDLRAESLRGYSPLIPDEITEGGISRRRSAPIMIDLNPKVFTVRQFSEPSGIFSNYWRFPQATHVILEASPVAAGYAFTGWFANGARLDDPLSLAANITVAITNDLTLIGKFTAAGADVDQDGLPDSFELLYFNTLAYSGASDPDGDGFDLRAESLRGYSPLIPDEITEGGISRRRSNVLLFIPPPPEILQPPAGTNVVEGQPASLSVAARGIGQLYYQWRLNGVNLPGETNAQLYLPAVAISNSGGYSVAVATPFGATNSAVAVVSILAKDLGLADNLAAAPMLDATNGLGSASNRAATRERDEPLHSGKPGTNSLWLAWRAPADGIATFSTRGSAFDTLLAVYAGESVASLAAVASDDDSGGFYTSSVAFAATNGAVYRIAVDGLRGAQGHLLLKWSLEPVPDDFPRIVAQPISQAVAPGAAAAFSIQAAGRPPLAFQWYFNGQAIPGASGATLRVESAGLSSLGLYQAAVRTATRTNWSEPASLQTGGEAATLVRDKARDLFRLASFGAAGRLEAGGGGRGRAGPGGGGYGFEPVTVPVSFGSPGIHNFSSFAAQTEESEINVGGKIWHGTEWLILHAVQTGDLFVETRADIAGVGLAAYAMPAGDLENLVEMGFDDDENGRCFIRFKAVAGTDYLVVWATRRDQPAVFSTVWTMGAAPVVGIPPQPRAARVGEEVVLSVWAAGVGALSYQWRRNGAPIPGATNSVLTLPGIQPGQAGLYDVVVANAGGQAVTEVAQIEVGADGTLQILAIRGDGSGMLLLQWVPRPGRLYRVQYKQNLLDPAWAECPATITTNSLAGSALFPRQGSQSSFYRLVEGR